MFQPRRSATSYQGVNVPTYRDDYYSGNQAHTLIDVRTQGEFRSGHIPGAVNIPMDQISSRANEIPTDHPVIIVCATGNRSGSVVEALITAGYERIYNLEGGTMNWMMLGLPLDR